MATLRLRDIEVRYVRGDGELIVTTLGEVDAESVARGRPVRRARSYAGQRHYSGLFWSATTGGHVLYESRLELDRLLLADFDPDVEWLATQPMWLSGADGAKTRAHVPDLLTRLRAGGYLVTDVKPAEFAARPEVAQVFAWTGRACAERGWRYEVWSGDAPAVLDNLRFLAQGRRPEFLDPEALRAVRRVLADGMTFAEVECEAAKLGIARAAIRPALLAVLWAGEWSVDLRRPLCSASGIERVEVAV
jgi:hypothetical protein